MNTTSECASNYVRQSTIPHLQTSVLEPGPIYNSHSIERRTASTVTLISLTLLSVLPNNYKRTFLAGHITQIHIATKFVCPPMTVLKPKQKRKCTRIHLLAILLVLPRFGMRIFLRTHRSLTNFAIWHAKLIFRPKKQLSGQCF